MMRRLAKYVATFAVAALMSSSALAAISYSEDFESYDPANPDALANAGWLVFGNVFGDYPNCTPYWYGYGPFPAPNAGGGFSNITNGYYGQVLNVFSDYNNGDHGNGACIESNVFQERVFTAADADTYTFRFFTEAPAQLGDNVSTYGYVKLLNPATGYSTDLFLTTSTVSPGWKEITVVLDASADGKILQWGFSSVASNYVASGRYYDFISFTPAADVPDYEYLGDNPVPIPLWAMFGMAGLLAFFGLSRLHARRKP